MSHLWKTSSFYIICLLFKDLQYPKNMHVFFICTEECFPFCSIRLNTTYRNFHDFF